MISTPPRRLTPRQRQVADLVAQGLSNREIAGALFISERTVEGHIQQLFNMLAVSSRTHLAVWWTEQQGGAPANDPQWTAAERPAVPEIGSQRWVGPSILDPSRTNLPLPLTTFVGRQRELQELSGLRTRSRLVTILGVGGVGKTRLATEHALAVCPEYRAGVWLVDLTSIDDREPVARAVLAQLGVGDLEGLAPPAALIQHARGREMLLIFDGCEHLLEAAAHLVTSLLSSCPHVGVLATSRQPLLVPGELSYRISGLGDRADHAAEGGRDAARLFIERTRYHQPGFEQTEPDITTVERICRRLDGIPLAIELAAAWTRSLSLEGILERLDRRFDLLVNGPLTAAARHRTLAANVEWSTESLDEPEQALLRRLSIFGDSFDLSDVAAVCLDAADADLKCLHLVDRLVQKSLVVAEDGRFRLLETIRAYACRASPCQVSTRRPPDALPRK